MAGASWYYCAVFQLKNIELRRNRQPASLPPTWYNNIFVCKNEAEQYNHATNAPSKPSAPPPGVRETPRRPPGKTAAGTLSPQPLSETQAGPTPRRGRATPSRVHGNPPETRSASSAPAHANNRAHPRVDHVTYEYCRRTVFPCISTSRKNDSLIHEVRRNSADQCYHYVVISHMKSSMPRPKPKEKKEHFVHVFRKLLLQYN